MVLQFIFRYDNGKACDFLNTTSKLNPVKGTQNRIQQLRGLM